MVSQRTWFALATAGVIGLFYAGHGLHQSEPVDWQLPTVGVAQAQEAKPARGLVFKPCHGSRSDFGSEIAKVPGGWLVKTHERATRDGGIGIGLAFLPDPEHRWDWNSLP